MSWIEPLSLQTWIMQVFSGSDEIFLAIALLFISGMAGYFRMNSLGLFFMIIMFLLMFSGFISSGLLALVLVISGLLIGYVISKTFSN
jgi:hypothetical protein